MHSAFYIGPIVFIAHCWLKAVYYKSKMMLGLEKLKRMKSENDRLQEECERLESFMLEIESAKSCNLKNSEENEAEEYAARLENLKNLELEIEAMTVDRENLLKELEIAKKQKEDSVKAFQDHFQYQGLRRNPHLKRDF